jgi:hypothetical protein
VSKARDHALAHRLVLASLTGDDHAFVLTMREMDDGECRRATAMLADCTARVLLRSVGIGRAIHEVENYIWNALDEIDAEQP